MRAGLVDERDARALSAAEFLADHARQLEPSGPAADDHDVGKGGVVSHQPLFRRRPPAPPIGPTGCDAFILMQS